MMAIRTDAGSGGWGWIRLVLLSCALMVGWACSPAASEPTEAVEGVSETKKAPPKPAPYNEALDPCKHFAKLPNDPPTVLKGKSLVLTRLLKPCVRQNGRRGWQANSPYLAMGFPCTGGSGRVDYKGHYHNPKMLAFILGTDCGMAPDNKAQVQAVINGEFGLPPTVQLAAYTPFVVQYWELPGMQDADTGYTIELRSAPAVEGLWRRFQQHEPIRVSLYGRENTWAQGDAFYAVDADLLMTGRTAFQLTVVKVKPLTKEEIAQVKTRCEALRPLRKCGDVF